VIVLADGNKETLTGGEKGTLDGVIHHLTVYGLDGNLMSATLGYPNVKLY
jgi:hypothetical protein